MKKRFLILSSLITLLLTCFSLPIYADEDPSDPPSSVPVPNSIRLDQYFFDNYILLPYIESDGNQYIDTSIKGKSDLLVKFTVSDIQYIPNSYLFGEYQVDNALTLGFPSNSDRTRLSFYNQNLYQTIDYSPYLMINFELDKNIYRYNSGSVTFNENTFTSTDNLYVFATNRNGAVNGAMSSYKLYNLSIYDYSTESFVRYYYPAKSKSGNVVGLYDAVSDTFITTSGSVPFTSPIDDQVLNLQIGTFLTSSIGWITDILEFAIETPVILIFMAIGLAGAMFRWGRKLVHF